MPREELKTGYAPEVIQANVATLEAEGRSPAEARAIAHRKARNHLAGRLQEGVEVFRAGSYPGKATISEQDLEGVVKTYNEQQAPRGVRYQAAAKHTHASDMPALGWVSGLSRNGASLVAQFADPSRELLDGIIEQRYPNPSVEFRRNLEVEGVDHGLSLRAVGFMGADPPAVKSVAQFSDDDDTFVITFNEWTKGDRMSDEHKLTIEVRQQEPENKTGQTPAPDKTTTFSEQDLETARKEAADKAREEAKVQFAEEQAKKDRERLEADNLEFCEGLVKAGKMKPSDRGYAVALLNGIGADLTFSEGDGDKAKDVNLAARTRSLLAAGGTSALFSEQTPSGDVQDATAEGDTEEARDKKIRAYAEKKDLNYTEAYELTEGGYTFPA